MLRNLFGRLWSDESGAVIATEYLMLGSIVSLGGVSGLVAMRDAMVDEYKEFGSSVRNLNQSYSAHGTRTGVASGGGSAVSDEGPASAPAANTTQPMFSTP